MEKKSKSKRDIYGGEEDWRKLLGYIKKNIMKLPESCAIPRTMVLKIDGLSKGEYISNSKIEPVATYQYEDILSAFKIAEQKMRNKTNFKSSEHRLNYAIKIVENNINEIVKERIRKSENERKIEELNMSHQLNERADYIPSPKLNTKSKIINSLW